MVKIFCVYARLAVYYPSMVTFFVLPNVAAAPGRLGTVSQFLWQVAIVRERPYMDAPGLPSYRSVMISKVEIAPVHSDCWREMNSLSLMGFAGRHLNRFHAL